jgi:hypothetical protein
MHPLLTCYLRKISPRYVAVEQGASKMTVDFPLRLKVKVTRLHRDFVCMYRRGTYLDMGTSADDFCIDFAAPPLRSKVSGFKAAVSQGQHLGIKIPRAIR